MNKKGLIGKIILITILLVIAIIGFTAWQAYSLVKTAMSEGAIISTNIAAISVKRAMLNQTDCDNVVKIEASATKLASKVKSSCMNPIIRMAVDKMQQVAIKCKDVPMLESQLVTGLAPIKTICANLDKIVTNQTQAYASSDLLNFSNATQ